MASGDKRWIPQVPGNKDGLVPAATLNEILRHMVEMIYQLEGRRGEIEFRDTISLLNDGKKSMISMKDDFIDTSFSFGGNDRKSFFVARGAAKSPDGTWLATDLSASILEWASSSGLNYYYNTGLGVGQSFTPLFQGNVGISSGTFVTADRSLTGAMSVSGGGDLSANRTFTLVNDSATPGASMIYGTDALGVRGWQSAANTQTCTLRLSTGFTHNSSGNSLKIPMDQTVENNNGMADLANSRMVCLTPGLYFIWASMGWTANATGIRACNLYVNGATIRPFDRRAAITLASSPTQLNMATSYRLALNDTIEFYGYQNSGGSLVVLGEDSSPFSTAFGVVKLAV